MLTNNPFEEAFQETSSPSLEDPAPASVPPPVGPVVPQQHSAASAALSGSPTRHAAPAGDRVVLAKFRVAPPSKGKEMVRPITYFPIYTEILADNDGHLTSPDVPECPYWHYIETGIRRNDWTRGTSASVLRRYSEVVDLQELLGCMFPTIFIPPLPCKNSVKDIETYFGAEDAMETQRHNLQFFLKEIAAMPELMFFCEWMPSFFLDPRDTFETGTLLRMRATLHDMRLANKHVDEFSRRRRTFAEEAASKIAAASTKIVRSVTGMLWGAGSGKAADGATPTGGGIAYDWSTLSTEDREEAHSWERLFEVLSRRQKSLKRSARCFEAYLSAAHAKMVEQGRVAEAMQGYVTTLCEAAPFDSLGRSYQLAVGMLDDVTQKEKKHAESKYLNVCLRLLFESNFVSAVLDAIDRVLCLYQWLSHSVYDMNDTLHVNCRRYTRAVSDALREDYNNRYKKFYVRRMRNLIREQVARSSMEMASGIERAMSTAPLIQALQDNDFNAYRGGGDDSAAEVLH